MKKILFILSLFFTIIVNAQSDIKKIHYEIKNPAFELTLKYEKALTHTELDALRFLNERRQIPIEGSKVIIELYSAQELLQKYGKKISPLTAEKTSGSKRIKLKLADNNYRMIAVEFQQKNGWVPMVEFQTSYKTLPSVLTGSDCASADPFCTGSNYSFPASTNTTSQTGPDYGCLLSQPNPAWYYMQVATSGNIIINISGSAGGDVDFICWGPFNSPTAQCSGTGLNSGNIVDCSYSASATETCTITAAVSGQFYMLLLTNFSGQPQNIDFQSDPSSTGSTNCSIVCGLTASNTGPYCVGQTINLNSTLVAGATYTWTGPGGVIANTQNTTIPNATMGMSGTYTVSATDANGVCTSTVALSVVAGPTVSVTSTTVCAGAVGTLTASGVTSYTWSTGVNASTMTASPAATTVYTVSGTTGSCPVTTATGTITVTPQPTITVNSPTICSGSNVVLTANGGATYTWSANAGGVNTSTVSVSPAVTTVYTITANNGGTCSPPVFSTVTVVASLSVTVNVPPSICAGASATLTANGAASYTWSPATGLSSVNGTTVAASPAVTTSYTVTGSSGSCPTASATTTITVIPSSTITVNSATICPTTSETLTAVGSTTYSWSPATGLSSTSGPSVIASPASTTVYTVSGPTCVTAGTCTVTVAPSCSITVNSASICPAQAATLTANGAGPYSWAPASGLSATTGAVVTASPGSTSVYTVTSVIMGFTSTATSTVTVNSTPSVSVNNATICEGSSTSLIAQGASTYAWVPATGLSATTASIVVASPTITTSYTITGTAITGCTNTAVSVVGVNAMPTVSITPVNSSGCSPLCVGYTSFSSTSSLSYQWNFGDGSSSTAANPSNCFKGKGVFSNTLTLTDGNGCKGYATSTVTVYPQPLADFSSIPQPASILEPTIHFTDISTNGPVTIWNWDFGAAGSGDTSHIKNPKFTYLDTGSYSVNLWVRTQYGCKDSTIKIIKIDDDYEFFVPNAFSPNGDNVNDVFFPITTGVRSSSYHLYIYDRWGNLIFDTIQLDKGWDGAIHGKVVQEDVYVWRVSLVTTAGIKKQIHGQVSIVK